MAITGPVWRVRRALRCAGRQRGAVVPSAFAPGARPRRATITPYQSRFTLLAKTPRTWTGARSPSGLKRVRSAERRREILQPRRTAAKTYVAKALTAASAPSESTIDPVAALAEALSALDRAAKVGAIHPNAAARRKSRLTRKVNAALGGAQVQTGGRVVKTTGKAAAQKAAKARIAAGKAGKAKGAQTAAGKARAALSKTARAEAAAAKAAAATSATEATPAKATAAKAPTKTTAKAAPKKTTAAKTASKPAAKATAKPTAKPAAKATAKPAAKKPAAKA
jgi:ribosomal protein S20